MDLASAAIEADNPSAMDGLAKTITVLNGSVSPPNWQQFAPVRDADSDRLQEPNFDMPAIDFPMPMFDVPAINIPMPKLDSGPKFDIGQDNLLGDTRDVMGIDSLMPGRSAADSYLRDKWRG